MNFSDFLKWLGSLDLTPKQRTKSLVRSSPFLSIYGRSLSIQTKALPKKEKQPLDIPTPETPKPDNVTEESPEVSTSKGRTRKPKTPIKPPVVPKSRRLRPNQSPTPIPVEQEETPETAETEEEVKIEYNKYPGGEELGGPTTPLERKKQREFELEQRAKFKEEHGERTLRESEMEPDELGEQFLRRQETAEKREQRKQQSPEERKSQKLEERKEIQEEKRLERERNREENRLEIEKKAAIKFKPDQTRHLEIGPKTKQPSSARDTEQVKDYFRDLPKTLGIKPVSEEEWAELDLLREGHREKIKNVTGDIVEVADSEELKALVDTQVADWIRLEKEKKILEADREARAEALDWEEIENEKRLKKHAKDIQKDVDAEIEKWKKEAEEEEIYLRNIAIQELTQQGRPITNTAIYEYIKENRETAEPTEDYIEYSREQLEKEAAKYYQVTPDEVAEVRSARKKELTDPTLINPSDQEIEKVRKEYAKNARNNFVTQTHEDEQKAIKELAAKDELYQLVEGLEHLAEDIPGWADWLARVETPFTLPLYGHVKGSHNVTIDDFRLEEAELAEDPPLAELAEDIELTKPEITPRQLQDFKKELQPLLTFAEELKKYPYLREVLETDTPLSKLPKVLEQHFKEVDKQLTHVIADPNLVQRELNRRFREGREKGQPTRTSFTVETEAPYDAKPIPPKPGDVRVFYAPDGQTVLFTSTCREVKDTGEGYTSTFDFKLAPGGIQIMTYPEYMDFPRYNTPGEQKAHKKGRSWGKVEWPSWVTKAPPDAIKELASADLERVKYFHTGASAEDWKEVKKVINFLDKDGRMFDSDKQELYRILPVIEGWYASRDYLDADKGSIIIGPADLYDAQDFIARIINKYPIDTQLVDDAKLYGKYLGTLEKLSPNEKKAFEEGRKRGETLNSLPNELYTPEQLRAYNAGFSERIQGPTGSPFSTVEEIDKEIKDIIKRGEETAKAWGSLPGAGYNPDEDHVLQEYYKERDYLAALKNPQLVSFVRNGERDNKNNLPYATSTPNMSHVNPLETQDQWTEHATNKIVPELLLPFVSDARNALPLFPDSAKWGLEGKPQSRDIPLFMAISDLIYPQWQEAVQEGKTGKEELNQIIKSTFLETFPPDQHIGDSLKLLIEETGNPYGVNLEEYQKEFGRVEESLKRLPPNFVDRLTLSNLISLEDDSPEAIQRWAAEFRQEHADVLDNVSFRLTAGGSFPQRTKAVITELLRRNKEFSELPETIQTLAEGGWGVGEALGRVVREKYEQDPNFREQLDNWWEKNDNKQFTDVARDCLPSAQFMKQVFNPDIVELTDEDFTNLKGLEDES